MQLIASADEQKIVNSAIPFLWSFVKPLMKEIFKSEQSSHAGSQGSHYTITSWS